VIFKNVTNSGYNWSKTDKWLCYTKVNEAYSTSEAILLVLLENKGDSEQARGVQDPQGIKHSFMPC